MCGVVGIVYDKNSARLGQVGSFLLKKLEYRGYDSTGGAFFKTDGTITLKKKVGSPTKVIHELDLEKLSGRKFIGQVRWATYGAVTDENAQPHEVNCRTRLLGAHNGNISNTDSLKEFLIEARHRIRVGQRRGDAGAPGGAFLPRAVDLAQKSRTRKAGSMTCCRPFCAPIRKR